MRDWLINQRHKAHARVANGSPYTVAEARLPVFNPEPGHLQHHHLSQRNTLLPLPLNASTLSAGFPQSGTLARAPLESTSRLANFLPAETKAPPAKRESQTAAAAMKIGCLQFAPQVGDVNNNLNRADAVLNKANAGDLDLLVLPEMAFSGMFLVRRCVTILCSLWGASPPNPPALATLEVDRAIRTNLQCRDGFPSAARPGGFGELAPP